MDPEPTRDEGQDEERVSITDVHGTVAHFEMTYEPPAGERFKFGPPLRARLPSALYLAAALVLGGIVWYAYALAPSGSWAFAWVVEGDRGRPVSASVLATAVVVSALGTVVRTHMRGVIVSDDWVEARYLLVLGIPRARRWSWAQVSRLIIDGSQAALELWDGSFEPLPEVAAGQRLVQMLAAHAERRRIDVTLLQRAPRR
jgi:hypothetical protein